MILPTPNPYCPAKAVYGFGFDSQRNDYKVVWMVKRINNKCPFKVQLYSLNERSWRGIDVNLGLFDTHHYSQPGTFVKGVIYWLAVRQINGNYQKFVLSLDLSHQIFEDILLPEILAKSSEHVLISIFDKSLAVIQCDVKCCHVWVMEEYGVRQSWTKLFSIGVRRKLGRALAFSKNGKIILSGYRDLALWDT